jgi:hypothetical protein
MSRRDKWEINSELIAAIAAQSASTRHIAQNSGRGAYLSGPRRDRPGQLRCRRDRRHGLGVRARIRKVVRRRQPRADEGRPLPGDNVRRLAHDPARESGDRSLGKQRPK